MEDDGKGNKLIACPTCNMRLPRTLSNCPRDGTALQKEDELEFGNLLVFTPGAIIDERYEILSLLGLGGVGSVYKARHTLLNTMFAIKFLHPQLISKDETLKRFELEAKTVSLLKHPNIVGVHDYGVTREKLPYIVMEYLEGRSLAQTLKEDGTLNYAHFFPVFEQVCGALSYAHSQGIIHRDLKPGNVVITTSREDSPVVKIVDFGMAKLMPQEGLESQHLTQTGEVFGSPLYMSPEQCMGETLDARSDIYSVGCVMYEALTGKAPHRGVNVYDTIRKQIYQLPTEINSSRSDIKDLELLEAVVLKALAKEPSHRYQTMNELSEALKLACGAKRSGLLKNVQTRLDLASARWNARKSQSFPSDLVADILGPFIGERNVALFKPVITAVLFVTSGLLMWSLLGAHSNSSLLFFRIAHSLSNPAILAGFLLISGLAIWFLLSTRRSPASASSQAVLNQPTLRADSLSDSNQFKAEPYLNEGVSAIRQQQFEKAVEILSQAISIHPTFALAYVQRGIAYTKLKQYQNALDDLNTSISYNANSGVAFLNRAIAYHDSLNFEQAKRDCDQAIRLSPQYVWGYHNRARAYRGLGQYEKAIEDFGHAIRLNPKLVHSYSERGFSYHDLGNDAKALDDYNTAISIDPSYYYAYDGRGDAWAALGQTSKAIADWSEAERLAREQGNQKNADKSSQKIQRINTHI